MPRYKFTFTQQFKVALDDDTTRTIAGFRVAMPRSMPDIFVHERPNIGGWIAFDYHTGFAIPVLSRRTGAPRTRSAAVSRSLDIMRKHNRLQADQPNPRPLVDLRNIVGAKGKIWNQTFEILNP